MPCRVGQCHGPTILGFLVIVLLLLLILGFRGRTNCSVPTCSQLPSIPSLGPSAASPRARSPSANLNPDGNSCWAESARLVARSDQSDTEQGQRKENPADGPAHTESGSAQSRGHSSSERPWSQSENRHSADPQYIPSHSTRDEDEGPAAQERTSSHPQRDRPLPEKEPPRRYRAQYDPDKHKGLTVDQFNKRIQQRVATDARSRAKLSGEQREKVRQRNKVSTRRWRTRRETQPQGRSVPPSLERPSQSSKMSEKQKAVVQQRNRENQKRWWARMRERKSQGRPVPPSAHWLNRWSNVSEEQKATKLQRHRESSRRWWARKRESLLQGRPVPPSVDRRNRWRKMSEEQKRRQTDHKNRYNARIREAKQQGKPVPPHAHRRAWRSQEQKEKRRERQRRYRARLCKDKEEGRPMPPHADRAEWQRRYRARCRGSTGDHRAIDHDRRQEIGEAVEGNRREAEEPSGRPGSARRDGSPSPEPKRKARRREDAAKRRQRLTAEERATRSRKVMLTTAERLARSTEGERAEHHRNRAEHLRRILALPPRRSSEMNEGAARTPTTASAGTSAGGDQSGTARVPLPEQEAEPLPAENRPETPKQGHAPDQAGREGSGGPSPANRGDGEAKRRAGKKYRERATPETKAKWHRSVESHRRRFARMTEAELETARQKHNEQARRTTARKRQRMSPEAKAEKYRRHWEYQRQRLANMTETERATFRQKASERVRRSQARKRGQASGGARTSAMEGQRHGDEQLPDDGTAPISPKGGPGRKRRRPSLSSKTGEPAAGGHDPQSLEEMPGFDPMAPNSRATGSGTGTGADSRSDVHVDTGVHPAHDPPSWLGHPHEATPPEIAEHFARPDFLQPFAPPRVLERVAAGPQAWDRPPANMAHPTLGTGGPRDGHGHEPPPQPHQDASMPHLPSYDLNGILRHASQGHEPPAQRRQTDGMPHLPSHGILGHASHQHAPPAQTHQDAGMPDIPTFNLNGASGHGSHQPDVQTPPGRGPDTTPPGHGPDGTPPAPQESRPHGAGEPRAEPPLARSDSSGSDISAQNRQALARLFGLKRVPGAVERSRPARDARGPEARRKSTAPGPVQPKPSAEKPSTERPPERRPPQPSTKPPPAPHPPKPRPPADRRASPSVEILGATSPRGASDADAEQVHQAKAQSLGFDPRFSSGEQLPRVAAREARGQRPRFPGPWHVWSSESDQSEVENDGGGNKKMRLGGKRN